MAVIGIDLGTTNSLVSVWTEQGPKLIKNALGAYLTPSVVGLDDDQSVLVGEAAQERLLTHPELTIADFKRLMGTSKQIRLGTRNFRPEELSALVLRSLRQDAIAALGEDIEEAIISVPAYFNDLQRKATLDASQLAGLHVERLINEPTAAALAYGLDEVEEAQFLVFDLGGGTFDVSILDKYDNVMEVRSSAGDNYLGGNDFRAALVELICGQNEIEEDKLEAGARNRLLRAGEQLKKQLSTTHEESYSFAVTTQQSISGTIRRDQFEHKAEGLLRRLRQPLERAIGDAVLRPQDIENVVLVGGATRMPMVRKLVARLFGKLPLSHLDPDHLVALGAAVQVGLKTRHSALDDVVMTDVCPYTLGIAIVEGELNKPPSEQRMVMSSLIERNAVVPISRSATYHTTHNYQRQVDVEIYQGENLRPHNNVHLGTLSVKVPRGKAGEQFIEVRFTYDINGALEVEVTSDATKGKSVSRIFKNQCNLSDAELNKRFRELEKIKTHPRELTANRTILARAERIYAEQLGEKRDYVRMVIARFEEIISDQHNRNMERDRQEFSSVLDDLEQSVFAPQGDE